MQTCTSLLYKVAGKTIGRERRNEDIAPADIRRDKISTLLKKQFTLNEVSKILNLRYCTVFMCALRHNIPFKKEKPGEKNQMNNQENCPKSSQIWLTSDQ